MMIVIMKETIRWIFIVIQVKNYYCQLSKFVVELEDLDYSGVIKVEDGTSVTQVSNFKWLKSSSININLWVMGKIYENQLSQGVRKIITLLVTFCTVLSASSGFS